MIKIAEYGADKGSCIINGVGINNGVGDGSFDVYYVENEDEIKDKRIQGKIEVFDNIWFDLREDVIKIWTYDCNEGKEFTQITRYDLNCMAVTFGRDINGNIYFIKYF